KMKDVVQEIRGYSTRVRLDAEKLAARGLTTADVLTAMRQHNLSVAVEPGAPPDQFVYAAVGRPVNAEEFGQIPVQVGPQAERVKMKDVVREVRGPTNPNMPPDKVVRPGVELGAKSHDITNKFDDKPTVGLAIFILPESNALEVAKAVKD